MGDVSWLPNVSLLTFREGQLICKAVLCIVGFFSRMLFLPPTQLEASSPSPVVATK